MHWCLTYKDEESSLDARMQDYSPEENTFAHHLPSIADDDDDDDAEEHFPTASLDDDIWKKESVPERHL